MECNNNVKIGSTNNPTRRLKQLIHYLGEYGENNIGRFAISECHSNYIKNEKVLHKHFKDYRISNTELFIIGFDECLDSLPVLQFDYVENESYNKDELYTKLSDVFRSNHLYSNTTYENPYKTILETENLCIMDDYITVYRDTANNDIYISANQLLKAIHFPEKKITNQIKAWKNNFVTSRICIFLVIPTNGGNQSALCFRINHIALALSQIFITETMIEMYPDAVEKLIRCQYYFSNIVSEKIFET